MWFWKKSVWTLVDCKWCAGASGLKPLRLPRDWSLGTGEGGDWWSWSMGAKAGGTLRACQGEQSDFHIPGIPTISFQSKLYYQVAEDNVNLPTSLGDWYFGCLPLWLNNGLQMIIRFRTIRSRGRKITSIRDVGGGGKPKKAKRILYHYLKKTNTKNPIS